MTNSDYLPYLNWIDDQRDRMIQTLVKWAEINSGSDNLEGLDRMLSTIESEFDVLGGISERIDLPPYQVPDWDGTLREIPLGKAFSLKKRVTAKDKVFLCVHMDTVFPADHPFQHCSRPAADRLQGPGVADAKGGIMVMLTALQALERSPWANEIGWEVLVNPDEEIGSPGSASLMIPAAGDNDLGLVFEPSFPDGSLVGDRRGSGNFTATVKGRAAHAGREPHLGRNAINALAEFIVELNALHRDEPGINVNVGAIRGGGPVNVVPDLAMCRFNVRVSAVEDRIKVERNLERLVEAMTRRDGISMELSGGFGRPPRKLDARVLSLLLHVTECGRDLGLSLSWRPSGGACDGNNLALAGLLTIDSLGVRGGHIHSSKEFVLLDSLTERAKLTALLLFKLASGAIPELLESSIRRNTECRCH